MSNCCGNNSKKIDLKVEGMSCGHCKMVVEETIKSLEGIKETSVELDEGLVKVTYNPTVIEKKKIEDAIEKEGYKVL